METRIRKVANGSGKKLVTFIGIYENDVESLSLHCGFDPTMIGMNYIKEERRNVNGKDRWVVMAVSDKKEKLLMGD
jgi:hypothetical protein